MPIGAQHTNPDHVGHTAAKMAAMGSRLDLGTVPAAWPTSVSQLALAIDTCQRCDAFDVCNDWLAGVPKAVTTPPAFCANAATLKRAKEVKKR